jgi:small subunit ribosomal protein S9
MATTSKTKEENKYFEAVGRRKTSIARVRLFVMSKGAEITINEKSLEQYFPTAALRKIVEEALITAGIKFYNITAKLKGGGIHSQAEALRHGISRAILKVNAEHRKPLKIKGFLKRDPRMKERRKFGLKKARKSPQWAKR